MGSSRGLLFAQRDRADHLRRGIFGHCIPLRHAQGFQRLKAFIQLPAVRDSIGVKLEVDPLLQSHFLDGCNIARTRTKGQAIQSVQNFLVPIELLLELPVIGARFGIALGIIRACWKQGGETQESRQCEGSHHCERNPLPSIKPPIAKRLREGSRLAA